MINERLTLNEPEQFTFFNKTNLIDINCEDDLDLPVGAKNLSLEEEFSFDQLVDILSAGYALKFMEMFELQELKLKSEGIQL